MKRFLKWLIAIVLAAGAVAGLTFAFIEGREEMEREREREQPVKTPSRTTRGPGGEAIVKLDAETRQRVAIAIAPLTAASHTAEVRGFGTILDPTELVTLSGELVTAEVALTNSMAQYQRTKALFDEDQNASRRVLDLAEAQQRTDAAKLKSAQQRWRLATAGEIAKLNSTEREQLVARLVNREVMLARVEIPPGELAVAPMSGRLVLQRDERESVPIRALHPAPSVDEKTRGQSFFVVIEKPPDQLRPGAAVTAYLSAGGERQTGVVVPARSVVRAAGLAWAYVQSGEHQFTRKEVSLANPTADGWFVTANFKPGDQVVVTGAQTLLSEEFKSQISVGDEAEKE